mgnify:CR=1 FL=1
MAQANEAGLQQPIAIARFGPGPLFASLLIGSTGTLILGLQPVLLGALLSEKRLTFDGIALVATVEMLAIGIGSALFAILFSASHMRIKAAILLLIAALGQSLTADAVGLVSLTLIRALTGFVEGALIAVAVEAIARTDQPGRNGGWFVIVQTIAQSILALVLALAIVPAWGSFDGFHILAMTTMLTVAVLPWVNNNYGPLARSAQTAAGRPGGGRALVALCVIFTLYLFIGAIWAFLEPLGGQSGISAQTVGLIVSISLLAQVLGALAATALEPRLHYTQVIGGAAVIAVLIAAGFALGPSLVVFWALSLATGFLWLFVVPWQIGMTLAADSSRKTTLLVPAAQLFGAAIGPAGAAALISPPDFHPAAWFACAAAATSFILLVLFTFLQKQAIGGANGR